MKKSEIQFDPDVFLSAVQDIAAHATKKRKLTLRTTSVLIPKAAPEISPDEIVATREALNLSQPLFAKLLNVPTVTAISWEKGRRKPSGAALRLLQIARSKPDTLLEIG